MGPGVWVVEGWDTDPFYSVSMAQDGAMGRYDLGETQGVMGMWLEPSPTAFGRQGGDRWLSVQGTRISKPFAIRDNRQGPLENPPLVDPIAAAGFEALQQEHLNFWRDYFAASSISIPDEQFQHFYEASLFHFKAAQNRFSGGLPVNNLRLTWSSHVFWDSYFIQRALLEANHRAEALEACRFFQRTLEHARRHAQEEFGHAGLKWDWEITHDGRKAYGVYLHLKDQAHNNGSYANEIWQYYEFTHDLEMLREFYPILEGLARFFLEGIVEPTARGYEIRSLVGVTEKPELVKNEGLSLSATIAILRHAAQAARILEIESDFSRRCAEIA
jgi:trehalose/maltose hydrolase-like predicted phosphorylase